MRIKYKKALKGLIKDREIKLKMVRMDHVYYSETGTEIMKYDIPTLKGMVVEIEAEMKAMANWGKDKKEKRAKLLSKKYAVITKQIAEYEELQNQLSNLVTKEKDFVDYIKFLKDYLMKRRWRNYENTK